MTKLIATPSRRIALAIVLSVLLHGLTLWLPEIQLPTNEKELPLLVAKLEALPKISSKVIHKPRPKPRPKPLPLIQPETTLVASAPVPASAPEVTEPVMPVSAPVPASVPEVEEAVIPVSAPVPASAPKAGEAVTPVSAPVPASSPDASQELMPASAALPASAPSANEVIAASAVSATSAPSAMEAITPASAPLAAEAATPAHPALPKHARLRFNVFQGERNFKVGESIHKLEIKDGRYTLTADIHTTGLASMFKSYRMLQTSTGSASEHTLRPEIFSEVITDENGEKSTQGDFDWAQHIIRFSNGKQARLPSQAQDILSILYQFPPMREQDKNIAINIGTGKKIETYNFEVVFEEKLDTIIGPLHTIHFRKLHAPHDEGLEIWFAQEYRFLPVKIRYLDREGNIAAEAIITSIRVSDE